MNDSWLLFPLVWVLCWHRRQGSTWVRPGRVFNPPHCPICIQADPSWAKNVKGLQSSILHSNGSKAKKRYPQWGRWGQLSKGFLGSLGGLRGCLTCFDQRRLVIFCFCSLQELAGGEDLCRTPCGHDFHRDCLEDGFLDFQKMNVQWSKGFAELGSSLLNPFWDSWHGARTADRFESRSHGKHKAYSQRSRRRRRRWGGSRRRAREREGRQNTHKEGEEEGPEHYRANKW